MDVLTSETGLALNNEIKKASDIKLVSLYSPMKIMHGTINIKCWRYCNVNFTVPFKSNYPVHQKVIKKNFDNYSHFVLAT